MASGNLEVIVHGKRHYAFAEFEGYRIHDALERLISYQGDDFAAWFYATAPELRLTIGDRLTMPEHRTVIDADAKHIDMCGHYLFPTRQIRAELRKRGYTLTARYDPKFLRPTAAEEAAFLAKIAKEFP